jgi:hypothetical protein
MSRQSNVKKQVGVTEAGDVTGKINFEFSDGTVIEFDSAKVPTPLIQKVLMHGYSQKLGDSYASASQAENPLSYAKAAVQETIEQLYKGEWRSVSVGGGGVRITDLAVALSRLTGKTVEESQSFVETLDDDQKKAWRSKGKVKATLAGIAAEKAAEKAKKLAAAVSTEEETAADESVSF